MRLLRSSPHSLRVPPGTCSSAHLAADVVSSYPDQDERPAEFLMGAVQQAGVIGLGEPHPPVSVLRERGKKGLPLDELYRQLFNPQLYLVCTARSSAPIRAIGVKRA